MKFMLWREGIIFIGLFFLIIAIPCFLTAVLGTRLIENLGNFPSRNTRLQMGICLQLLLIEICAFFALCLFFYVLSG